MGWVSHTMQRRLLGRGLGLVLPVFGASAGCESVVSDAGGGGSGSGGNGSTSGDLASGFAISLEGAGPGDAMIPSLDSEHVLPVRFYGEGDESPILLELEDDQTAPPLDESGYVGVGSFFFWLTAGGTMAARATGRMIDPTGEVVPLPEGTYRAVVEFGFFCTYSCGQFSECPVACSTSELGWCKQGRSCEDISPRTAEAVFEAPNADDITIRITR